MRWLYCCLLIVGMALSGHPVSAARSQAVLGDTSSQVVGLLGKPLATKVSGDDTTLSYGRCRGRAIPRESIALTQDAVFTILIYECNGRVPTNWRTIARSLLPPDAHYVQAQKIGGILAFVYQSDRVAEQVPGASCNGPTNIDGYVMEFANKYAYGVGVMACLQPTKN